MRSISTPAFHHWHHTLAEPQNRNFASMLPCMDRIFGTHYLPRKQWPAAYGIEAKLTSSLVGQLIYPLIPSQRQGNPPEPLQRIGGRNRRRILALLWHRSGVEKFRSVAPDLVAPSRSRTHMRGYDTS